MLYSCLLFQPDLAVYTALQIRGPDMAPPLNGQIFKYDKTGHYYESRRKNSHAICNAARLQGIPISTRSSRIF